MGRGREEGRIDLKTIKIGKEKQHREAVMWGVEFRDTDNTGGAMQRVSELPRI